MPLQLTPRLDAKVEEMIAAGSFSNAEDVMEEALRLLDERERLQRLRASLIEAEQQTERGEVVEWTPELSAQIRREAEEMARQRMKPDPDVCP
jgi:antitoxin ParD1/3/4